jgi:two-component system, sensor histidine kinase and response regulator
VNKPEKIKILYVDDEMNNLLGFKASFRLTYNVLIAQDSEEALKHLQKHPDIRVIFSDQRMPEVTGVQFFEEMRADYPKPIRILITGYTDVEAVINAINFGNVFRYVKKPWSQADILTAISEANKFYVANMLMETKNAELQVAYDELDKFAYSVTHDMRNPLLSILGAVDISKDIDDIDEIRQMLHLIKESVGNLDAYIQNIHDYYNVNRGQLQISEIDFNDVVEQQLETHRLTAKMKQVSFNTKIVQNEAFRGDAMSMNIILNNLLSNAFKYQKKDRADKNVELNITVDAGELTMCIKDNGIGISGNHIGDIFNMFFRATSQDVGSGFGLYNVKDALIKLNGEIKVDSILDEGTTFTVKIRNK